ncbi:hypothetical protein [Cryobacterium sp. Y50]|uniref:hypothetical protein n=1 Tax=Cryobacterium sp. Y50 TaxID=2048286 RepID=UPI0011B0B75E|nr:hypothetical protein [Cryobacterium sp. Y50]
MSNLTPPPPLGLTPPNSLLTAPARARTGARPGPIIMLVLGTVLGLVAAGVHTDLLEPIAAALLVGGGILLLIGGLFVVFGAIGLGRHLKPEP